MTRPSFRHGTAPRLVSAQRWRSEILRNLAASFGRSAPGSLGAARFGRVGHDEVIVETSTVAIRTVRPARVEVSQARKIRCCGKTVDGQMSDRKIQHFPAWSRAEFLRPDTGRTNSAWLIAVFGCELLDLRMAGVVQIPLRVSRGILHLMETVVAEFQSHAFQFPAERFLLRIRHPQGICESA